MILNQGPVCEFVGYTGVLLPPPHPNFTVHAAGRDEFAIKAETDTRDGVGMPFQPLQHLARVGIEQETEIVLATRDGDMLPRRMKADDKDGALVFGKGQRRIVETVLQQLVCSVFVLVALFILIVHGLVPFLTLDLQFLHFDNVLVRYEFSLVFFFRLLLRLLAAELVVLGKMTHRRRIRIQVGGSS
ncbi:BQ5605_C023g09614 [Microbotryum silenes-dioicae]|uniref:BQ5605_C023g09614 protein n=1 Tax=Microbotryum silenes-dioicae TaxID=796604 RepID=A0A2X0PEW3_9BASI|nr:BQ5605_C023g09614 [Microbotryum silenes-dioicae]